MATKEIDRIESAIRHIQTSTDIDSWATEIAIEAMQKPHWSHTGTAVLDL